MPFSFRSTSPSALIAGGLLSGAVLGAFTGVALPPSSGTTALPRADSSVSESAGNQSSSSREPDAQDPSTQEPSTQDPGVPAPDPGSSESTAEAPSASPTRSEEQVALDKLNAQAEADRDLFPDDGRWAVQLASKYVGSTDRYQTPHSGGDTFSAADIWYEHQSLRRQVGPSYTVILLHRGTSLKKNEGRKFWYTYVVDDFGSKQGAQEFCDSTFHELSKAERANQCLPKKLPT
jgi:hypothetical protein